jgi:hypothetical protein
MRAHGERPKRMTIRFVSSARTSETASFLFTRMIGGNSVDLGIVGKGGSAPVIHPPSTITILRVCRYRFLLRWRIQFYDS